MTLQDYLYLCSTVLALLSGGLLLFCAVSFFRYGRIGRAVFSAFLSLVLALCSYTTLQAASIDSYAVITPVGTDHVVLVDDPDGTPAGPRLANIDALPLAASQVTSGTFTDARIAASNVTQHEASINHDNLAGFVANEHLDWSADQGATNLHDNNVAESSVTQHEAAIDHDALTNFVANEHIDWTSASVNFGTTGNIGGGTVSPNFELHLFDGVGEVIARLEGTAGATIRLDEGDKNFYVQAKSDLFQIYHPEAGQYLLEGDTTGNLAIGYDAPGLGNLSIGTTTAAHPGGKLAISGGTLLMQEQAAADADVAAYGQIWVKTATPNQLWFTDDAGTDVQLGAATGDVSKVGTPVNNQIGVWTGDGTIEGDAGLVFNGTDFGTTGKIGGGTLTPGFELHLFDGGGEVIARLEGTAGATIRLDEGDKNYYVQAKSDLFQIYHPEAGQYLMQGNTTGDIAVGYDAPGNGDFTIGSTTAIAKLGVIGTTSSDPVVRVRGASGQTAELAEFQDNGATVEALVSEDGEFASTTDSDSLAMAATSFAATSNVMIITGDVGSNTIATITDGEDGQLLTLIFVDALVTITDDNTHAADSIDLSAAFTSADDTTLQLVYDGTSWYEVSRSAN